MAKKGRGFGAVCYSSPLAPGNLQWISAVSTAYVVAVLFAFVFFFFLLCVMFIGVWIFSYYRID